MIANICLDHAPAVVVDLYNQLVPIQVIEEEQALLILMSRRLVRKKAVRLLKDLYAEGIFRRYEDNGKYYTHLKGHRITPAMIDERKPLITALWVKLIYAPTCETPLITDMLYPIKASFYFKKRVYGIILPGAEETNIAMLLDDMAVSNHEQLKDRSFIIALEDKTILDQIRLPQHPDVQCDFAVIQYTSRMPEITIYRREKHVRRDVHTADPEV